MSDTFCLSSAVHSVLTHGVEPALAEYPELLQFRPMLEELDLVSRDRETFARMVADCERRLDELSNELADRLENAA